MHSCKIVIGMVHNNAVIVISKCCIGFPFIFGGTHRLIADSLKGLKAEKVAIPIPKEMSTYASACKTWN